MALFFKNLLFTLVVPGTVAVYLPLMMSRGRDVASGAMLALAIAVLVVGAAIYAWCLWDFATFGRGTPAPIDAPKRLVVRGLYHYTRNPMYLGVLTVILGWATLFGASQLIAYALVAGGCFHGFIVLYEEPHLAREFGSQYEDYRAKVPRWLPNPGHRPSARR